MACLVPLGLMLTTTLPAAGTAKTAPDAAARLLRETGSVSLTAAGPYVQRGTFRIQVSTALGRPDAILAEDIWLYHARGIVGSAASGTLMVRFAHGRVAELALVSPAVVAELRAKSDWKRRDAFAAKK